MKILVGIDGSEHSARAVAWCAKYAPALGAEIIAVHAVEMPVLVTPGVGYVPVPPISDADRDAIAEVAERRWCSDLATCGAKWRVELRDGPPATVIIEVAREEDADLVVTGRRGHGGFAELLLGSTSHQLSHHLDRPLVIVP